MQIQVTILVLIIIVLVIIAISRWLYFRMMFKPTSTVYWKPDIPYLEYRLTPKGRVLSKKPSKSTPSIHLWYFNTFGHDKTILFCHGNTGNITEREYVVKICYLMKINLLMFDYRGYGQSTGIPTIGGIKEDAIAAYGFLRHQTNNKIIVWGESLGGIVASYLAAKVECSKVVLFSTFSTLNEAITFSEWPYWLKTPISLIVTNLVGDISNKKYIQKLSVPVIIVHSKTDNLIPHKCAQEMHRICKNGQLVSIVGNHDSPNINKKQMRQLFYGLGVKISNRRVSEAVLILNNCLQKRKELLNV